MTLPRSLRFWSRHLLLLNVALLALVWMLYGELTLRGHGYNYAARARDFWLVRDPGQFDSLPGVENVLLPGLAAALYSAFSAAGWDVTDSAFLVLAAIPYPLFIYAVTRHLSRNARNGPPLAVGAAILLYTSGMIPYMTSWGGYLDGVSYVLMLPVFIRPESLLAYAIAFSLQCLNHYLGALALLMFAFVWHSMRALEQPDARRAATDCFNSLASRFVLSVVICGAFISFWDSSYPEAAHVRQEFAMERWKDPAAVLNEVLGRFPWTMLSTLKLGLIPVAALMAAKRPVRPLRGLVLGLPFLMAVALTLLFVDVTRVATMLVLPALLVTFHAAGSDATPPHIRRRLRRWLIAAALLNLMIPNYYVNNGEIIVPRPHAARAGIWRLVDSLRQ